MCTHAHTHPHTHTHIRTHARVRTCRRGGKAIAQSVHRFVTPQLHEAADLEMEGLLNSNYELARDMLSRNQGALDALVAALLDKNTLSGDTVRALVEAHASAADLERRRVEKAVFM